MNRADKLILAGVVTIPLAGAIFFGILTLWVMFGEPVGDVGRGLFITLSCLAVAIAAGFITAGVLLRKSAPLKDDRAV